MHHEVVSVSEGSSSVHLTDSPYPSKRSRPEKIERMTPCLFVGVDPDLKGGLVALHHTRKDPIVYPTRTFTSVSNSKKRKKIDINRLICDIQSLTNGIPAEQIIVHIESAPVYNNGVVAAKTIGYCLGIWETAFASVCREATVQVVHPRTWQTNFPCLRGLKGKDRKTAIYNYAKVCLQSHLQQASSCTGIADAYMIACCCRDGFMDPK